MASRKTGFFRTDGEAAALRSSASKRISARSDHLLLAAAPPETKRPPIEAALFGWFGPRAQELRIDIDAAQRATNLPPNKNPAGTEVPAGFVVAP